ncbi:MAG: HYR domain-containing protein [Planctomycetaceae bacterium]
MRATGLRSLAAVTAFAFVLLMAANAGAGEPGDLVWAKRATATQGNAAAAFADGSSVVTGFFGGSAVFGPGEPNETTLVSAGSFDVFVARYNANGTLAWARRAGSATNDQAFGVGAFSDGSSVVTGFFQGAAVFGPGEPNATTLVSAGLEDVFVARYNANGTLAWARRAGGGSSDQGFGAAAFSDGSSVVTGFFGSGAVFGPGEPNATTLVSAGFFDVFVARYNANGTLAWARRAGAGGLSIDEGLGAAAFSDDSSVVTGFFQGAAVFGPGEPNATTLVSAGGNDVFVARYNANGTLAWARRAGGAGNEVGRGAAAFSDGASVVTGLFLGSAVFGLGEPNATTLISAGSADVFLARYNANGTLAWARRAGSATNDQAFGVGAFSDGSSVVTGFFTAPATFGAGEPNQTTFTTSGMFVARYAGDQTAEIVAPADIVQECDDHDAGTATVNFVFAVTPGSADLLRVRDVTGARTLLEVSDPAEQTYGVGPVAFPHGPASVILIELLDGATVVASATFTVQIEDTIAPVIAGAVDQTIELQGPLTTLYRSMLGITLADACDPNPTVSFAPGALGLGTTPVTATARDATGNTSVITFNVTVEDTTPPVFTVCPEDMERHCEADGVLVSFDALAEDLSGAVEIACQDETGRAVDNSGTLFDVGEHTVTCTATDSSGNTATCSFHVSVIDDEAPVIVCPEDITVGNEPGVCFAYVEFNVTATDECDPEVGIVTTAPWGPVQSGDAFPMGTTTVTSTARDHSGNEATCMFNITVEDREPPVLSGPATVTLVTDCSGSPLTVTPASLGVTATDNCDTDVAIVALPASVAPGTTAVVCTATDDDGNESQKSVQVTVLKGPFECRFLRPLDQNVDNLIQPGQTVPVKVRISCANIFEPGVLAVIDSAVQVDGQGTPIGNDLTEDSGASSDNGNVMRLVAADEQHIYNLSTKGWPKMAGARFRVTIRVTLAGHVDTLCDVILKNK